MKAKVFIPSPLFYIMKITFCYSCYFLSVGYNKDSVYMEKGEGKDDA